MKNVIWTLGYNIKIENIVKAENCSLYDSEGNRYFDLESGVWCTSIGHTNKRLVKVIKEQLEKIIHTGYSYCNPVIEETAEKILGITKLQGGKCEYFCSGSEAVEFGMRVARRLSDKPKALKFSDSYFGSYGDATKTNDRSWYEYDWLNCTCNSEEGCIGECDDFKKIPFDDIGAFIFEPGSSGGLVRFPGKQIIQKISDKIKEREGVIVVNEITTGIGRTGKWFGHQHYDISPDIVAMGKGIGNGYPVSATAISKEIAEKLKNEEFFYFQSHQNDPLGATVAGEVIDIIFEEGLLERCQELGKFLNKELNSLKNTYPVIKEIRSRGLMFIIEFENNATRIYDELFKQGFILVKRNKAEALRMDPALTIELKTLEKFIGTLSNILRDIKQ